MHTRPDTGARVRIREHKRNGARTLTLLATTCLTVAAMAAPVAAATQPFAPQLGVTSSSYAAGSTPTLTTTIETDPGIDQQLLRSAELELPRGLFPTPGDGSYCDLHAEGDDYACSSPSALVGTATVTATVYLFGQEEWDYAFTLNASLYRERPESGELGRLVMVTEPFEETIFGQEVSITIPPVSTPVALSGGGDRVSIWLADLPTTVNLSPWDLELEDIHIDRIEVVLDGTDSAGNPLLMNPTFCDPGNSFDATLTSYGADGYHSSDDESVSTSIAYPVTGCDGVPFDPRVTLSTTSSTAGQPSSFSFVMELPAGSASLSSATTSLPSGMLLNPDAGFAPCDADDLAAASCPASSRIGTITLNTPLVAGDVSGAVYVGPANGSDLTISTFFSGQLSARMDSLLKQRSDGGVDMALTLPPIPLTKLAFTPDGAPGSILLNPYICDDYSISAALASHSGKTASFAQPLAVTGCSTSAAARTLDFDATLSTRRPHRTTNMRFRLRKGPATPISKVKFKLPKGLRIRSPRHLAANLKLGYVEIWDSSQDVHRGTLRSTGKGNRRKVSLKARNNQLRGLKAVLRDRGKRDTVTLTGLPATELAELTVSLFTRQHGLARAPRAKAHSRCTDSLVFGAQVFDGSGERADAESAHTALCARR